MEIANSFLKAANALLNFVVVSILCLMMAYAGYALWDNSMVYKAVDDVQADMLKLKPEPGDQQLSFEQLRKINPDVRAWVTLDGTKIDYPVLQGENNLSYINTDVYGKFALAGSIFLDSRNDGDFKDDYSLLYGHDMENHKMFGDLALYKEEKFFQNNQTGMLILPDREYDLKIFATLLVSASEERIFNPETWQGQVDNLFDYAEDSALHLNEKVIEASRNSADGDPQIIAFTTCSSEYTQARTVVLAVMEPHSKAE